MLYLLGEGIPVIHSRTDSYYPIDVVKECYLVDRLDCLLEFEYLNIIFLLVKYAAFCRCRLQLMSDMSVCCCVGVADG